jgi:hypothetical protein
MEATFVNPTGASTLNLQSQSAHTGEQFEQMLETAQTKARVREAAEQFVASAFLLPMFAQMQKDPFRSDLMHGGFAEDAWQGQLNTILADRIAKRGNSPLVETIVDRMMEQYTARINGRKALDVHG